MKLAIKTVFIIYLLGLIGCKSNSKLLVMSQLKTERKVVFYLDRAHKEIVRVKLPVKISIYNSFFKSKTYSSIEYDYNPYTKGISTALYKEKNGELKNIEQGIYKSIYPYQTKEYIVYTRHRIDSSPKQLKPYVQKMLEMKQDTLIVGTVQEFKQKHKELLKQLTTGDSIYLRVLNAERNGYEKGVKIPVKF